MSAAPVNPFLIVDGHAYAYRAFYAIRALRSPGGRATNAIYGFLKMLGKLRGALGAGWVAVVWDGGLSAQRREWWPDYKAQRPPMPDELAWQIGELQAGLGALGVASLCRPGVEADDWIGSLAGRAAAAGLEVVIASADKDFMQLVGGRIRLLNPNDKTERLWGAEQVREKTGVRPEQVVDWLSLVGDSVDNIPGVPGVGPKTAAELLGRFGDLAGIYARLDEVRPERVREALRGAEAVARGNVRLVRLHEVLTEPFEAGAFRVGRPDVARLRALYDEWGFKGLRQELDAADAAQPELSGLSP